MCVEETTEPSSSTIRAMWVSNASWASRSRASPRARWPKRKSSPTETRRALSRYARSVTLTLTFVTERA